MPRKRIRRLKAGYVIGRGPTGGGTRRRTGAIGSPVGGTETLGSVLDAPLASPTGGTTKRAMPGPTGSGTTRRTGPKRTAAPAVKVANAGPRRVLEPGQKRRIRKS